MHCSRLALIAALASLPAGAIAQNAQGDVAVTIYNNNQALVQDVRQVTLPAGRTRQEFPDVSAQIRPETVTLSGDGFGIVEQNFDYDLLTPSALMEKAVGQTITLVRTNPATGAETRERALVLAANGGVVLKIGERIEVLRDDGLPVRVVFDSIPPNLRARPTLSVTLDLSRPGPRPLTLSYLTPSLGWSADYVTLFDEKAQKIDVQGWVTLTNNTGTTFSNARVLMVAGDVGTVSQRYNGYRPNMPAPRGNAAGSESGGDQIGDFHVYPIEGRTTIANAQTKQVSFLNAEGVPRAKGVRIPLELAGKPQRGGQCGLDPQVLQCQGRGNWRGAAGGNGAGLHARSEGPGPVHRRKYDPAHAGRFAAGYPHRRCLRRQGPACG